MYDYDGRLASAMTAHPKLCPITGELHFFGYGFFEPYLTYNRVTAAGELVQSEPIAVGGPTMMHDFSITEHYVIFMDLPVVFDFELAMKGGMPYRWDDDYPSRVGVMPRSTADRSYGSDDVQWFDVDPCYVFHPMNSFEEENALVKYDLVSGESTAHNFGTEQIPGEAARSDGAASAAGSVRIPRQLVRRLTHRPW